MDKIQNLCPCGDEYKLQNPNAKVTCKDLFYNSKVLNYSFTKSSVKAKKKLKEALEQALCHDFTKCMIKGLNRAPRTNFKYEHDVRLKNINTECFDYNLKNCDDEAFICRCFYKRATGLCTREDCPRYSKVCDVSNGKYKFVAYQIPPLDGISKERVGAVDVVIQDVNTPKNIYFTEVKPRESDEKILRMICEICTISAPLINKESKARDYLTYKLNRYFKNTTWDKFIKYRSMFAPNPEYSLQKAIAFFEGSEQEQEYRAIDENPDLKKLLTQNNISVFLLSNSGKITKL